MNKNYQRGVRFERMIIESLVENGYSALRTAGSHGFADVVGMNALYVRMIQGKVTKDDKIALGAYKADIAKIKKIHVPENVTRELWIKIDRKEPYKVLIL